MRTTTRQKTAAASCIAVFILTIAPATLVAGSRGIVTTGPVRPVAEERGIVTTGPIRPNPLVIVASGPVLPVELAAGERGVVPYDPLAPVEGERDQVSVNPFVPLMPYGTGDSPVASSYAVGTILEDLDLLGVVPYDPLVPVGERGIVASGPVIVPDLSEQTFASLLEGVSPNDREAVADITAYLAEQMMLGEESEAVFLWDRDAHSDTTWFGVDDCGAEGRDDVVAYGMGVVQETSGELLIALALLVETDSEMYLVQIQLSESH